MKVFVLEFPLHKPNVGLVHYFLFHGVQAPSPHWRPAPSLIGDEDRQQLVLVHNARRISAVFSPDLTLVVSETVANQLSGIPHSDLRVVRFHRLVNCPIFAPGDDSYQEVSAYRRALESEAGIEGFFDYLPDASPELAADVGNYYELIPTRLKDVTPSFPTVRTVRCRRPHTIDETNELLLCPELVEEYPVTWWSQAVLHERVFRILEPHLDFAFAEVVEINL